jgi:hypothetical protein
MAFDAATFRLAVATPSGVTVLRRKEHMASDEKR